MRLLLDTHAVVWWWQVNSRLSDAARDAIGDPDNEVLLSAASVWELSTKYRLGKWPDIRELLDGFEPRASKSGFSVLSITSGHAHLAGSLVGSHRDPFDRMMVAQCLVEEATLVSADAVLAQFGVDILWASPRLPAPG